MSKERLKQLLVEYGRVALTTYLVLFGLVLAGFAVAFSLGFEGTQLDGGDTLSQAGVFGAAYLATKLTQPLRILATVALTPLLARFVGRKPAPRVDVGAP